MNGVDLVLAVATGRARAGHEVGGPGELADVADEVRLVGVAGVGRDLPPVR
jgi:hypothetical protein